MANKANQDNISGKIFFIFLTLGWTIVLKNDPTSLMIGILKKDEKVN